MTRPSSGPACDVCCLYSLHVDRPMARSKPSNASAGRHHSCAGLQYSLPAAYRRRTPASDDLCSLRHRRYERSFSSSSRNSTLRPSSRPTPDTEHPATTLIHALVKPRQFRLTRGQTATRRSDRMKRPTLACSVAAFFCLGSATSLFAVQPVATVTVTRSSPGQKTNSPPLGRQKSALTICAPSTIRWRRAVIGWADLAMVTATRWRHMAYMAPA